MRYFLISCIWAICSSSLSSAELANLFSSGADNIDTVSLTMNDADDLSFLDDPDVSSDLYDSDLFTSDPVVPNLLDRPFGDLSSNKDLSFFPTDTSFLDFCSSPSSKTRKFRTRSESCPDPDQLQPSLEQNIVPTANADANEAAREKIRNLWCGFGDTLRPAAKMPVCENVDRYVLNEVSPNLNARPVSRGSPYADRVYGNLSERDFFSEGSPNPFPPLFLLCFIERISHIFLSHNHLHARSFFFWFFWFFGFYPRKDSRADISRPT